MKEGFNEDNGKISEEILKDALLKCVDDHVAKHKITYNAAIGTLAIVQLMLASEAVHNGEE